MIFFMLFKVTEIFSDDSDNGTKEGGNSVAKKTQDKSRRDSDSSSIEMLEEFRRKSIEDEDHDEASSSSVTTTKVMKRGRGRPKSSSRKQGMMDVCIILILFSRIIFSREINSLHFMNFLFTFIYRT